MHYTKQKNVLKNKFLNKIDCHMTHYLGMAANKMEHYCLVLCRDIETAQHKSKDQLYIKVTNYLYKGMLIYQPWHS